jgi:hypothetical protein
MSILVIEHIKGADLPRPWAERLNAKPEDTFTVRIEPEPEGETGTAAEAGLSAQDPLFGIWRDYEETADVEEYMNKLRKSRY